VQSLTIQPDPNDVNKPLPYPFHVNEHGEVQRQDFWRGKVWRVVGFADKPEPGIIKLIWSQVWKEPDKAIGTYVVTSDEAGEWSVWTDPISRVTPHD
jgi:hypothetical protein